MILTFQQILAELRAPDRWLIGNSFDYVATVTVRVIMSDGTNSPPAKKRKEDPNLKVNSPPVQNYRGTQPNPSQTWNPATNSNWYNAEDISDYVPVKSCDRCGNHIPVTEGDWVRIFPMYGLKWICNECKQSVLYVLAD